MYIDVFTTNVHTQVSSQQTYCDEETGSQAGQLEECVEAAICAEKS